MVLMVKRLDGHDGKVTIKGLGSLVGEVSQWDLTRRGDDGPGSGLYDLRAVFSFLVPNLLLDPDYNEDRELTLALSKTRGFTLHLDDPAKINLQGKVMFMEGVALEWRRL